MMTQDQEQTFGTRPVGRSVTPPNRAELRTMLERLGNCLHEAKRHAAETSAWVERALAYRKTAESLALSCSHCRAEDAPHYCSGGEWLCSACLSMVSD